MEDIGKIIGSEQWYLLFLGIAFHFYSKINKARKTKGISFDWNIWFKDNWFDAIGSTILSFSGIFIAKDYLHFGEAPLEIRNLLIFTIGYNSNSIIKNWISNLDFIKKK